MSADHPTPPIEPELIDIPWLAHTLSISTKTVRRMADSGELPAAIRLGRLIRWRRSEISVWIADGCPRPSHAPTRRSSGKGR